MTLSLSPWLVDNVYPPDPDGEGPVHEGDNGLHLLEPEAPEVAPAQVRHVVDHSEPRHLGPHLPGCQLQQHVGGGVEILELHPVWIPFS